MINETSKFAIFLIGCCGIFWAIPAWGQQRTWIDNTGKNRVEAELIVIEKAVRLRKKNGVVITVPFSRLSPADIAYLERLEASSKTESAANITQPPAIPPNSSGGIDNNVNGKSGSPAVRETAEPKTVTSPPRKSPADRNSPVSTNRNNPSPRISDNETQRVDESQLRAIRLTLKNLKTNWPTAPTPDLLKEIATYAESNDKLIRSSALSLLGEHEPAANFDLIVRRLDDSSFEIRWQAYDILESLGDRRAIDPLIGRFSGKDCSKISSVLRSFGSEIEERIIPFLNDPSVDVRLSACDLLGNIGSGESVPPLEELRENATELAVRMQAQSALREIASRN